MSAYRLIPILLACLINACTYSGPPPQVAFYHWKTHFDPGNMPLLDTLGASRIWLKYFDVDWDDHRKTPVPKASIQWTQSPPSHLEVVPTVFITTRCLDSIPLQELENLAKKIAARLRALHPTGRSWPEVQLDCDWTPGTRNAYFSLIRTLKKEMPTVKIWSATIRLHQIHAFSKTGVPPVDRGMLMFYNMGQLRSWQEPNAILNIEAAIPYMTSAIKKYPLPLDLALPIYRWGAVFRNDRLTYLINNLDEQELQDTSKFTPISPDRYLVVANTYLKSYYLYSGDRIRLDRAEPPIVTKAAEKVANWFPITPKYISFYHLDSTNVAKWTYEDMRSVLLFFD